MNDLIKAVFQKQLTLDTVDIQFCSDWLKDQMKSLFTCLADAERARDAYERSLEIRSRDLSTMRDRFTHANARVAQLEGWKEASLLDFDYGANTCTDDHWRKLVIDLALSATPIRALGAVREAQEELEIVASNLVHLEPRPGEWTIGKRIRVDSIRRTLTALRVAFGGPGA